MPETPALFEKRGRAESVLLRIMRNERALKERRGPRGGEAFLSERGGGGGGGGKWITPATTREERGRRGRGQIGESGINQMARVRMDA